MPTRYLRLGPREQDTGSDDTSRRTEQDEEEFWPKLDKKTADRIGILNRWIYPVCRSVVTERVQNSIAAQAVSLHPSDKGINGGVRREHLSDFPCSPPYLCTVKRLNHLQWLGESPL